MLIDVTGYAFIGKHLGIQPSTSPSHRCGTEIKQHVALLIFRLRESLVDIFVPLNRHKSPLIESVITIA
jgi:hypothetical protein